ncbi:Integral membrane protein OS=Streptomyces alboniger OX=132473 GN=CP975_09010 PE=4 SV=1 [Streptomyces alboniger]
MDISGTQLRAVRAALFTALVVTLSSASHVLLSRVPLPLNTVAAIAAVVFTAAYALAGRERGFGRIAALLIPLELAADTVFTTGQHV